MSLFAIKMQFNKDLVLVSQSPRRKELMELMGVPFTVCTSNTPETLDQSLSIQEQIEAIAVEKALSVQDQYPNAILISADTVIVLDDEVLGKPLDDEDAFKMLKRLSGRQHTVITSVYVHSSIKTVLFSSVSTVHFYPMSDQEIERYVMTKEPIGRSGSYSIMGGASIFVKSIQGDTNAIMGLPIAEVYQTLKNNEW